MRMHNQIRVGVVLTGVAFGAWTLGAVEHVVTDVEILKLTNAVSVGVESVMVATEDHSAYPDNLPQPSFWIDATDRALWTLNGDQVTAITSKVGTRRLSVDTTEASWTGWGTGRPLEAPTLADDAELGCQVLDFGVLGSRRGLLFDKEGENGNKLSTIGTAFFVYGSQQSGGWLFGGVSSGYEWHRGDKYAGTEAWGPFNSVAHSSYSSTAFSHAYTRHNGLPYVPYFVGFTGGWEVFTLSATNATAAAELSALGLGIGDARGGMTSRSGGMKIAEMIIFAEVLPLADVLAVEDYLQKKWFNRRRIGVNGRARVEEMIQGAFSGEGKVSTLTTAAADKLEIGLLRGGRNKAGTASTPDTIRLAGSGTVALEDASRFAGDLELAGGTLALGARTVPSAAQLPSGMVFRFDASDVARRTTVLENGTNFVTKLANLSSQLIAGKAFCLRPFELMEGPEVYNDRRPWLLDRATPTGLPLMDFGPWCYWQSIRDPEDTTKLLGHPGRAMKFYYEGTDTCLGNITLTTIIAAVDARHGGGWLMTGGFQRAGENKNRTLGLLRPENLADSSMSLCKSPRLTPTNGVAYLDGQRVPHPDTTGYKEGQQVVALQIPGTQSDIVGGRALFTSGGVVLGEIMGWNRALTEEEIRDASAYLSRKWFGRTLPGYARTNGVEDAQHVIVSAPANLEVAAGTTARVDRVTLNAELVKKGGGTLNVGTLEGATKSLRVAEGRVTFGGERRPSSLAEIAPEPSLHFDPTDLTCFTTAVVNDKTRVVDFADIGSNLHLTYYSSTQNAPFFNYTEGPQVNGAPLPFVDFGQPIQRESGSPNADSHALYFNRPLEGVRTVFAVFMARQDSWAFFMGSGPASYVGMKTDYRYDWHRGNGSTNTKNGPLFGNNTAAAVKNGVCLKNGETFTPITWVPPADEWNLLEFHTLAGVHISAFAADRGTARVGGLGLGEVIIYERELTPAERIATRNYLRKKWFGVADEDLTPLPMTTVPTNVVEKLEVVASAQVEAEGLLKVRKIEGQGDVTKVGAGVLDVTDLLSFTGTVRVTEGSVKLSGVAPTTSATLPTTGLTLQLDANKSLTTEVNGTRTEVTTWADAREAGGWKAVSAKGVYPNAAGTSSVTINSNPTLITDDTLGGNTVVDMAATSTGNYECFRFKDGSDNYAAIGDIKTVLWVLGSHHGGGWLLGGGDPSGTWVSPSGEVGVTGKAKYYFWHRGSIPTYDQSAGRNKDDPLLSGSGSSWVRDYATLRVNEKQLSGLTTTPALSGEWDLISCRFSAGKYGAADGLAYDGRVFNGENYRSRCGNQRLAEVLIYSTRLTDAELKQAEEYLNVKWGLNGYLPMAPDALSVELGQGTTLITTGSNQSLLKLSGAGRVEGDLSARVLVADFAADATLSVTGTFTIPTDVAYDIRNLPARGSYPARTKVISAGNFAGAVSQPVFTDDGQAPGVYFSARIREGGLYLQASRTGFLINFR